MILVNDNWEQICDLQDVSNVIRENYNEDLADELDKLIPEHTDEEYEGLQWDYDEKCDKVTDLENEIDDLEKENERLEDKIDELEEKYKVYKIDSNSSYIGYSLVSANTAEEANQYIDSFRKEDSDNKCDSWGYANVSEDDVLEHIFSDKPGIIDYGISYYG